MYTFDEYTENKLSIFMESNYSLNTSVTKSKNEGKELILMRDMNI